MAITNTLTVDLTANTITLNSSLGSSIIDILVYSKATNIITFQSRPSIVLSSIQYFSLLSDFTIFESAIINNFNPSTSQTVPFTSITRTEKFDNIHNKWTLNIHVHNAPSFIINIADYSSSTVSLNNRPASQSLYFYEWQLVLSALISYQNSLHNFFGI
jgi:hypothetical protein